MKQNSPLKDVTVKWNKIHLTQIQHKILLKTAQGYSQLQVPTTSVQNFTLSPGLLKEHSITVEVHIG
uniref:Putative ovule protein n=1 Tax=Solanum chacoense TaxID=4108 RepID=A0A0V0HNI8_SOLCH